MNSYTVGAPGRTTPRDALARGQSLCTFEIFPDGVVELSAQDRTTPMIELIRHVGARRELEHARIRFAGTALRLSLR